jgi:hypothetical protein
VSVARRKLIAVASAVGLGLSVATQAGAAATGEPAGSHSHRGTVAVLDKPGKHLRESLRVAERRQEHAQQASPVGGGGGVASPESVGVSSATLEAIASCESGGDPTAVSADGTYRGKYQFDYGTWASVGGSGDPAVASEAEQDYRAALLYARGGSSPWPICGA